MRRKSNYHKGLVWEDPVTCYICSFTIDLSLPSVISIDGVLSRQPLSFTEDHLLALQNGGDNSKKNLKPAHLYCNDAKGTKDVNSLDISSVKTRVEQIISEGFNMAASNEVTCQNCFTLFYAESARIVLYGAKFCSRKCLNASLRTATLVSCETCKEEFRVVPSKVLDGRGRFCSVKCYASRGEAKIERECVTCGKGYFVHPSNTRTSVKYFCSTCRKDKNLMKEKVACEVLREVRLSDSRGLF